MVHGVDSELAAEDVCQLGAVTVLATDRLFLRLVVVGGGQKVTKDELGCPYTGFGVFVHGNAVAIIPYCNFVRSVGNINVLDGKAFGTRLETTLLTDFMVKCVHQDFVKDFEEARAETDGAPLHHTLLLIDNPSLFNGGIYGADVGIRKFKDMLTVRMLLVLGGARLRPLGNSGFRSGGSRCLRTHSTRCVNREARGDPCSILLDSVNFILSHNRDYMLTVYVTHYKPLVNRKVFMDQQFLEQNIKGIYITDYDKEELNEEDLNRFRRPYMSNGEISLFLKHVESWKQIIESKTSYSIVFEDDAILNSEFNSKFNNYMLLAPANFDIIFLGDGCQLHGSLDIVFTKTFATRCTDSMVISKKCAQKLYMFFNLRYIKYKNESTPVEWAIDHWLNYAIKLLSLNIYWVEPTIVTQGSQNGKFSSSLR